jgi:hypothetical protein
VLHDVSARAIDGGFLEAFKTLIRWPRALLPAEEVPEHLCPTLKATIVFITESESIFATEDAGKL